MTEAEWNLGAWLSAAMDDPNVCQEFKDDITDWFVEINEREAEEKVENGTLDDLRRHAYLQAAEFLARKAQAEE